ncbi:arginase family protein [Candidatus Woesearchaeota archaeon]|nr:arginase family protein [Candidatus Woesearchaeota archaeon]
MKTVLLVPFGGGSLGSNNNASIAPLEVINFLKRRDSVNESGNSLSFSEVMVPVVNDDFSQTHINIERFSSHGFSVAVGGDHSITYSLFRGFAKNNNDSGILVFDAHADCMHSFHPVTHENFLRCLIDEGLVNPKNVIIVGLRAFDVEERDFLSASGVKIFSMLEISREGLNVVCDSVMSASRLFSNLYISVDIDVLDPSFAPGTGYPEPGGLTTRDLLYFLQRLKLLNNIRCCDVVEVDGSDFKTVSIGAKIVSELL